MELITGIALIAGAGELCRYLYRGCTFGFGRDAKSQYDEQWKSFVQRGIRFHLSTAIAMLLAAGGALICVLLQFSHSTGSKAMGTEFLVAALVVAFCVAAVVMVYWEFGIYHRSLRVNSQKLELSNDMLRSSSAVEDKKVPANRK